MPVIGELATYLEKLAPLSFQEPYDNVGLLIGNPQEEVQGVMIALDITLAVLEEALEKKCNLIISHHPPIFRPLQRLIHGDPQSDLLIFAIRHHLALYAIHTNLDHVAQGVNHMLAERLGLQDTTFLAPLPQRSTPDLAAGAGMLGKLPAPLSQQEFLAHIKQSLDLQCIRYHPARNQAIHSVALCGGAGIPYLPAALASGADAFITADIKYHQFFDSQGLILLADIGHYESEVSTKTLLYRELSKKFYNIALFQCTTITNPIQYYVGPH